MKAFFEALTPDDPDWALAKALDPARLPEHIAIIMDGNGRWANRRSLPRVAGHKAGIGPVRSTVESCARLGIKALTLYAFSVENWKRPRAEVDTLWRLLRFYLRRELRPAKERHPAGSDWPPRRASGAGAGRAWSRGGSDVAQSRTAGQSLPAGCRS